MTDDFDDGGPYNEPKAMIKAKPWNGKDLKGVWEFTLKIDGVRALWTGEKWVSRAGKDLYNIPTPSHCLKPASDEGVEVYCSKPGRSSVENYKATIECVRQKKGTRPIRPDELYSLDPLDPRLIVGLRFLESPRAEHIRKVLEAVLSQGYEGLVLRQKADGPGGVSKWLKVKPVETYDVKVTGIIEGTGKHKGRMGALMTDMGKVGTGFSDVERENWWTGGRSNPGVLGLLIEVACMQLTPDGKFRHPRFVRIRYDK